MKLEMNAKVLTSQNEQIGELDRVVIDPQTKEVSHLVVRKGMIFTEDKVVPMNMVAAVKGEQVILREHAGDLQGLPKFEVEHHIPVDREEGSRILDAGVGVPPYYLYPPYGIPPYAAMRPTKTIQNIPEGTIALQEGAQVIGMDGEDVGQLKEVLTSTTTGWATHFIVSRGLLDREEKLIPSTWVSGIREDEVMLYVNADLIEALPEHEPSAV